jgi:hypothetical protein
MLSKMSAFGEVEATWTERLGGLRNVVRQAVMRAQLLRHLDGVVTVLDVGCRQGTQAVELADDGLQVVGVDRLVSRVRPGGLLYFTVRNGDALAFRPGLRSDWGAALEAFDADTYVNELGARASAHHLEEVLG